jgi:hypothetical protein
LNIFGDLFLSLKLPDDLIYVISDGLSQAGGGHPDDLWAVSLDHVLQTLLEVGCPAVNCPFFAQGGGCYVHRFPEVVSQVKTHVGGTPLRAVKDGHATFDSLEG